MKRLKCSKGPTLLSKETPMKPVLVLLACTFVTSSLVLGQGVGSSAVLTGTVVDSSGAVLPKVTESIVDTETGLKRESVTDGNGHYRLTGLSPSTYTVSASI